MLKIPKEKAVRLNINNLSPNDVKGEAATSKGVACKGKL